MKLFGVTTELALRYTGPEDCSYIPPIRGKILITYLQVWPGDHYGFENGYVEVRVPAEPIHGLMSQHLLVVLRFRCSIKEDFWESDIVLGSNGFRVWCDFESVQGGRELPDVFRRWVKTHQVVQSSSSRFKSE